MVAGWPGAVPYGTDLWARQKAEKALATAEAALVRGCRLGSARLGLTVAVGGSTDVQVVWSRPITVPYSVEAVAGPGLIGTAVLAVKSQTPTACVITVTASGLAVAVGAVVFAHAIF